MHTTLTPDEVTARTTAVVKEALDKLKAEGISAAMCASVLVHFPGQDEVSSQAQYHAAVEKDSPQGEAFKLLWWEISQCVGKLGERLAEDGPVYRSGEGARATRH